MGLIGSLARVLMPLSPPPLRRWAIRQKLAYDVRRGRHLVPPDRLTTQFKAALDLLAARLGPEQIGDYLEFGVYTGTSMICMHQALKEAQLEHVRLFGFDSFEGLPRATEIEDDQVWQPGWWESDLHFTRERLLSAGLDVKRFHLEKGWFSSTLTEQFKIEHGIEKAGVVMIDCDMYSSTVEALGFCRSLIKDHAVIFFDDWHSFDLANRGLGERRAFEEFIAREDEFDVQDFGDYGSTSKAFVIRRV